MSLRSFWGWGHEQYDLDQQAFNQYKILLQGVLGIAEFNELPFPELEQIEIRKPRFKVDCSIAEICSSDKRDRLSHSYGKSFRDIWRGAHGQFDNPPDYIAYPKSEEDIFALYLFAQDHDIAIIPYGGGSSVSGGVEPPTAVHSTGCITVDMRNFDEILEIDKVSRCARIQGGILGPKLEATLRPHGLTLRHFPQSFEFSTLGGWIATRSGGHFATLFTHIDEFVQSVRVVTPKGIMETRRLPGSGAGPSEERFISGSEGIFGIITEAWMRLQDIPKFKKTMTISFTQWEDAVSCCRAIAQSGLFPTNARLVDHREAVSNGLGNGMDSVLILGFESAHHEVGHLMKDALDICRLYNGTWKTTEKLTKRDRAADAWKSSFLRAPYLRDAFILLGCIMETFETAVTWDQFDKFHAGIMEGGQKAIDEIGGGGFITCRFTHLYPDGPAPYYTVIAKGQTGQEIDQWDQIKKIVSDKIIELGGTITHHHAVGRDHQSHYQRQSSTIFTSSMKAVKDHLDPKWILNPGVLLKE